MFFFLVGPPRQRPRSLVWSSQRDEPRRDGRTDGRTDDADDDFRDDSDYPDDTIARGAFGTFGGGDDDDDACSQVTGRVTNSGAVVRSVGGGGVHGGDGDAGDGGRSGVGVGGDFAVRGRRGRVCTRVVGVLCQARQREGGARSAVENQDEQVEEKVKRRVL